ncbi:YwdI family protein [Sporosarcina sp. Te-1]|uniref:YwdI family protein n=1 Tax=Sporosarcina sp. Te-1 TaxID=2818390 RepID=UPI001A9CFA22|nr:YwdI family protein [Sporosarcina sp. Te-1]QTD40700.1 YwdI family protein [Sporosarcina sp. Te-1]
MISPEQVLAEMERQLQNAKMAQDERAVREALAAIRSLCEVVLGSPVLMRAVPQKEQVPQQAVAPISSPLPMEGKPLEEEDANGGSLFDF